MKFGVPTEAQWEYACRAGTTTTFYFGDNGMIFLEYGWFKRNSRGTHPVGQRKPNTWGLYDMHGNVSEWCADRWAVDYYAKSPPMDPIGPVTGSLCVFRGGGWYGDARHCRSAFRGGSTPDVRHSFLGFRVACEIPYTPDGKIVRPGAASTGSRSKLRKNE